MKKLVFFKKLIGWVLSIFVAAGPAMAQNVVVPAYGHGTITWAPKDFKKNAVKIDGVPTAAASKPGVVELSPCVPSGLVFLCPFKWLSGPDTVAITASADVNVGPSVKLVTSSKPINIVTEAPEATDIEGEVGPIEVSKLTGTVELRASLSDDVGVESFRWTVNDQQLGDVILNPPAEVVTAWDTTTATPGVNRVAGIATDEAGNEGRDERSVMVGEQ